MPKTIFLAAAACLVCALATARAFSTTSILRPIDAPSVPPAVTWSSPRAPAVTAAKPAPASLNVQRYLVGQWAVGDGYSRFGDLRMDFAADGTMKLVRVAPPGRENIEEPGNWRVTGDVVEMWSAKEDEQVGWKASATVGHEAFEFRNGTFTPKGSSSRELTGRRLDHTFEGVFGLPFASGVYHYSEPVFGRPDLREAPSDDTARSIRKGPADPGRTPGT